MPLWTIYHPENVYTDEDKRALAERIVELYPVLPTFYVGTLFHAQPANDFFVGGQPVESFIRVSVDHIARQFGGDEELKQRWLQMVVNTLTPFTSGRGLSWELHIDETPFDLWLIEGVRPPSPGSNGERTWIEHNSPVPFEQRD